MLPATGLLQEFVGLGNCLSPDPPKNSAHTVKRRAERIPIILRGTRCGVSYRSAGWGQAEYWVPLTEAERDGLCEHVARFASVEEIRVARLKREKENANWWGPTYSDIESRRLLTATNQSEVALQILPLVNAGLSGRSRQFFSNQPGMRRSISH